MDSSSTRREWIKKAGASAAGAVLISQGVAGCAPQGIAAPDSAPDSQLQSARRNPARKRVLRIAHITDIHVEPERHAAEGFAACLRHIHALPDRPDFIINTGDCVMDSIGATDARTKVQWDVWHSVLAAECTLPVEHCIGNHDVWGINKKKSGATGAEPNYAKRRAMKELGLSSPYRSFDRAGWHFIALDSTFPLEEENTYTARLDNEQFEWLAADLAAQPAERPILIFSHIPIVAACAYFDGDNEETGNWVVPGAWMHIDARSLKDLFQLHPNIKLCISGHIHLVDRVEYLGVTYLCNGAVCGGWWKGSYQECPEGYAVIDLFDDGSFEHEYVLFSWKAQTEG